MTVQPQLALVVEDEGLQRAALASVLRAEGMDVIECESAEAAELLLCRVGPELSLLVTDVTLAGRLTGVELAEFARVRAPQARTIVVSGQTGVALPHGVSFLQKPFLPEELLRIATV